MTTNTEIKTRQQRQAEEWPNHPGNTLAPWARLKLADVEITELRAALEVESAALADAVRHVNSLKERLNDAQPVGAVVAMTEQQVCDMLLDRSLMSGNGIRLVMNGDCASLYLKNITAIVNAALATQPAKPADVGAVVADAAPSRFGSSELQAMIVQRAKQKEAAQENPQASTYPREIWLQAGECSPAETLPYTDGLELTWCWEGIDRMDVRYIRADIAPQPAPPEDLGKAIWHLTRVLSYTKACEGMLNVSPAGQVLDAEKFLSANPAKPADVGGVDELLGKYWEIAYSEGQTGVSRGTEAQQVLSSIRSALAAQMAAPGVKYSAALKIVEAVRRDGDPAFAHLLQDFDTAAPQPVDGAAAKEPK